MGTNYNGKNIANKEFFEEHIGYLAFAMCLQCTPHTEVTEENHKEIAQVIFEKELLKSNITGRTVTLRKTKAITKAAIGFFNGYG